MSKPAKLSKLRRLLLVEGYSDLTFCAELLEEVGLDGKVWIEQFNGVSDLINMMDLFLTPDVIADCDVIGVVADADDNPVTRANEIKNVLERTTGQAVSHNTWSVGPPKAGFFMLPDGVGKGELETLIWSAWGAAAANVNSLNCVVSYLDCMKAIGLEAHSPDKGKVAALLSVLYDEDPRPGPAARANVFDFSRPEYGAVLNFMKGFA